MAHLVLDSRGLLWLEEDRYVSSVIKAARQDSMPVLVSANTLIEVTHTTMNRARLRWLRSQMRVVPITESSAVEAAELLVQARMHGHTHALDATVVQTALARTGQATIMTSDEGDLRRIAGEAVSRLRFIPV